MSVFSTEKIQKQKKIVILLTKPFPPGRFALYYKEMEFIWKGEMK